MTHSSVFPTSADAVVAGCGIVGLAMAWSLARQGLSVVALDRGKVGGSTSAGTFAWVNASSKTADLGYHKLNAGGLARYEVLAAEVGAETIGLSGRGSLQWASPAEAAVLARLRADHAALLSFGYPVVWLDAWEMTHRCPGLTLPEDAEGLLATADRWLEVPRFLAWLRQDLERLGALVLEDAPLVAAERSAAGHIAAVETPVGRIVTPCLVVAAGTDSGELLDLASGGGLPAGSFPMRRVPGFLLETPPLALAQELDLVLWSPDAAGFHLRPTARGGLLLGADDIDAAVGEGDDPAAIEAATDALLRRAQAWLPLLQPEALRPLCRGRIGRRALPADGHSIVGPVAVVEGLYVAVTHSGVTLAPWIGQLLAEEMKTGRPAPELADFRPARFGI